MDYFFSEDPDPIRPNVEQLKIIALSRRKHLKLDTQTCNLYETLKVKFPNDDFDDPETCEKYEYYLKVCGGYYAEKNRRFLKEEMPARSLLSLEMGMTNIWRTHRMLQIGREEALHADTDDISDVGEMQQQTQHIVEVETITDENNVPEVEEGPSSLETQSQIQWVQYDNEEFPSGGNSNSQSSLPMFDLPLSDLPMSEFDETQMSTQGMCNILKVGVIQEDVISQQSSDEIESFQNFNQPIEVSTQKTSLDM